MTTISERPLGDETLQEDGADDIDYTSLVSADGRVDGRIYTDPRIFEAEMDRIFRRAWSYVAHESELSEPGAFVTDVVAGQPIIVSRGADGDLHAVANRCTHRGTMLCRAERGTARSFTCSYHGWKFRNTGELLAATYPDGYGAGFDKSYYDLPTVPRIDSYRGFVFVSFDPHAAPLAEYLGRPVMEQIDLFCDLSPTGRIEVAGGVLKYRYQGNWKTTVENSVDAYHAQFVHRRWMGRVVANRPPRDEAGSTRTILRPETRALGRGHSMIDFRKLREQQACDSGEVLPTFFDNEVAALLSHEYRSGAIRTDVLPDVDAADATAYVDAMETVYGRERARTIMTSNGTHIGVFPDFALVAASIRRVRPISVNETEVLVQAALLKDVPEAMNVLRLRGVEDFWGAASQGHTDDVEVWERIERGLASSLNPTVNFTRGRHRSRRDPDGTIVGDVTDEVNQRELLDQWCELMASSGRPRVPIER